MCVAFQYYIKWDPVLVQHSAEDGTTYKAGMPQCFEGVLVLHSSNIISCRTKELYRYYLDSICTDRMEASPLSFSSELMCPKRRPRPSPWSELADRLGADSRIVNYWNDRLAVQILISTTE